MNKLTLQFAAEHPTGAGHFPGNPIIPGALLLAEVLRCIERAQGLRWVSCNVKSAKFHHPVRPGDSVEIEYACSSLGVIDIRCEFSGSLVLSGVIRASDYA